ncbi:MAG: ATP synthase subunit I [Microcoleaceae cyanobacterium]
MNLPNSSVEIPSSSEGQSSEEQTNAAVLSDQPNDSMVEYYQLQRELFVITLATTGVIFVTVCFFYPLGIALSYLLGAMGSLTYLRMLVKDVEKLGREQQKLSKARLAVLVGLIIVAARLDQLRIIPIFLGFLTYKAALILYVLRTTLMPDYSSDS